MSITDETSQEQSPRLRAVGGAEAAGEALPDAELWAHLKGAKDPKEYAAAWLELQCGMIDRVVQGVVVLGAPGQAPFVPVAWWPEGAMGSPGLSAATEICIAEQRAVLQGGKRAAAAGSRTRGALAYPLLVDEQAYGAAAIEVERRSEPELRRIMRQLEWGCAWLEALVRRKTFTSKDRLVAVLELLATGLHYERFQAAATAVTRLFQSGAARRGRMHVQRPS